MVENPIFDFGQGASEQAIDDRRSPLESSQAPQSGGASVNDFTKDFLALNANTRLDIYGSGKPMSMSERFNAPVGPSSVTYAPESLTDQYMYQDGFDTRYFNPFDTSNYQKQADNETLGSALGKGFDSFSYKFGNTFVDYWKGYGRMAEALFTLDWDKMRPDETTMMDQYYEDQIDMKKNFVFEQPEDEDGIFTKRSLSEFVGNAGFALGTFAGLAIEIAADVAVTALTGGAGSASFAATAANQAARAAARASSKTSMLGKAANFGGDVLQGFSKFGTKSVDELKVLNNIEQAANIAKATPSALRSSLNETFTIFSNNILNIGKSKSFGQAAENILKGTPLLGTGIRYGERVAAAAKGGATAGQLTGLGLQGVRRVAQELNMSATEASFEAVTSYGDTLDTMVNQYKSDNNGKVPSSTEFEEMRSLAIKSSSANYNTNMAILLGTNKLQFGTLFNKFLPASLVVGEAAENILKVEAKGLTQLYKKGFTGAYGLTAQVARDFGKKEAAYQFGKAFFKDALKFEVVEGLQENLQETTASGWRDYYAGQMNGTQYTLSQAFGKGAEDQFTKQGLKTFLMGALTGSIIRLPTAVTTRALDKANALAIGREYKGDEANNPLVKAEKQLDADITTLNSLFKQAKTGNFEQKIFNFNAQMNASQEQTEAAAKGDKYEFENAGDNALLAAVATAKRTHSIDALYSVIKNMGNEMTAEDFKKSFGVDLESTKYSSAKEFSEEVAADIKKYSETIDKVREFAKSKLLDPNRFAKGSGSQLIAVLTRQAQEDAIQFIALNSIKGTMSADRAKKVASDILAMPQMGLSADYAVRIMTNYDNAVGELGIIGAELKVLEQSLRAEGLDPDVKKALQEQIKDKNEELALMNSWAGFWRTRKSIAGKTQEDENYTEDETFVFSGKQSTQKVIEKDEQGNDSEVEQEIYNLDHPEVVETFRKLINLKNKQSGNNTELSEEILREGFQKIYDYIRLDTDTRDYMRSVDVLMNLENFQSTLTRMTEGKFKHSLIDYTENLINYTLSIAAEQSRALKLSEEQSLFFTFELSRNIMASEAYKNLLALVIDPTLGMDNYEYAIKLQEEIKTITTDSLRETIANYKTDGLGDITADELDIILSEGSLDFMSIRRITIVDKLVKGQPLLANEKKLYDKFKEEIDADVIKQNKIKSSKENDAVAADASSVPVVGPDGEIINVTRPVEAEEDIPEVTPDSVVIRVDENGNETIEEVTQPSTSVKPIIDTSREWKGDLESRAVYTSEGVNTMRSSATNAFTNFGNPFSEAGYAGTIKVASIGEAVIAYKEWLLGTKHQDVKSQQRDWILDQINQGKLDGATLLYAGKLAGRGQGMHPTALAEVVEELRGTQPSTSVEETPNDVSKEDPVFTGETDADQLSSVFGITSEREDAFEVDATEEGAINVVDRNDNVVNPEPFPNEAAAQEQADSLNTTRANTDFVQKFIGPMIDPSDSGKFVSMQTRGEKSMERYNSRNNTTFATLEEYHSTPKGRELLEGIRESVVTGNPVKYKKSKSIVTTLGIENQPTLFSTTTSPATSASLTLAGLQTLHAEIQKVSEISSKFVEGPIVTEQSILDQLRDITECFS